MKLFVTGATGFLGSYFLNAAQNAGHEIKALKRPGSIPRILLDKEPEWVAGQLGDALEESLIKCDALVHFAACGVSPQQVDWQQAFYWNVMKTVELWQQAVNVGITRFLIAGTSAEYGLAGQQYDKIPPETGVEPIGPYAASKAASCVAAEGMCRESKLQLIYLRVFSTFGKGQFEQNLWPALKKKADAGEDFEMTKGEQVRDFIPVEDVATKFVEHLGFAGVVPGKPKIKNVGSGKSLSVLQFSKYWWKRWGATGKLKIGALPYRKDEVMRFVPALD